MTLKYIIHTFIDKTLFIYPHCLADARIIHYKGQRIIQITGDRAYYKRQRKSNVQSKIIENGQSRDTATLGTQDAGRKKKTKTKTKTKAKTTQICICSNVQIYLFKYTLISDAVICYACNDLPHPADCGNIVTCGSHEVINVYIFQSR